MRDSHVFSTVKSLQDKLAQLNKNSAVAFVPTMGALHHGHIHLVKQAKEIADVVVVSIFVNPTQFNNIEDLKKYPRTLDNDLLMLDEIGDLIIFAPSESEIYPKDFEKPIVELGQLEHVMEGEFRPGHFEGVVTVVSRLFDIVRPNFALFGLKDFQQVAVIRKMTKDLHPEINIVACETIREESGLASSSRNQRLSEQELEEAIVIYRTLKFASEKAKTQSPAEVLDACKEYFNSGNLRLEYMEIVDPESLLSISQWTKGARICIAAWCGDVRLIDNEEVRYQ